MQLKIFFKMSNLLSINQYGHEEGFTPIQALLVAFFMLASWF